MSWLPSLRWRRVGRREQSPHPAQSAAHPLEGGSMIDRDLASRTNRSAVRRKDCSADPRYEGRALLVFVKRIERFPYFLADLFARNARTAVPVKQCVEGIRIGVTDPASTPRLKGSANFEDCIEHIEVVKNDQLLHRGGDLGSAAYSFFELMDFEKVQIARRPEAVVEMDQIGEKAEKIPAQDFTIRLCIHLTIYLREPDRCHKRQSCAYRRAGGRCHELFRPQRRKGASGRQHGPREKPAEAARSQGNNHQTNGSNPPCSHHLSPADRTALMPQANA
ncbi:MAG TPA: hypothetical protein VFT56_01215 [Sphingomonas sp.]|nr:hypothetical protein [Sphingomonas sp.]